MDIAVLPRNFLINPEAMKNLFALLLLAAAAGFTNHATANGGSSVSFTNNAIAGGNNTFVNLALGKFDTGLGTLTGVVVTINFTQISGSFEVSTPADSFTDAEVDSADARVTVRQSLVNSLGYTQTGQTAFGVATTPGLPFIVGAPSLQTFNVTSSDVFVGLSQSIDSGFWSAYQSAGGIGSVVFQVRNNPDINVSGGVFTLNASAFTAAANMSVAYNYNPAEAIPEPGTWAVGLLLASGAAYTMWRRRQNTAASALAAA